MADLLRDFVSLKYGVYVERIHECAMNKKGISVYISVFAGFIRSVLNAQMTNIIYVANNIWLCLFSKRTEIGSDGHVIGAFGWKCAVIRIGVDAGNTLTS
jgi:hypothetical protein